MIAAVPRPSAVSKTIRQRQTCFCGLLRLATAASKRARSAASTVTVLPLRILETRTLASPRKSSNGLNRQIVSTRWDLQQAGDLLTSAPRVAELIEFCSVLAIARDHQASRDHQAWVQRTWPRSMESSSKRRRKELQSVISMFRTCSH